MEGIKWLQVYDSPLLKGGKVIDFNFRKKKKNSIRRLVAVYNDADAALSQGWGEAFV